LFKFQLCRWQMADGLAHGLVPAEQYLMESNRLSSTSSPLHSKGIMESIVA
jgi:hypothetical protein